MIFSCSMLKVWVLCKVRDVPWNSFHKNVLKKNQVRTKINSKNDDERKSSRSIFLKRAFTYTVGFSIATLCFLAPTTGDNSLLVNAKETYSIDEEEMIDLSIKYNSKVDQDW